MTSRKRKDTNVQLKLGFLEAPRPDQATAVWARIDEHTRAEIVLALARLVVRLTEARRDLAVEQEKADE